MWIETKLNKEKNLNNLSHPARGVWIETTLFNVESILQHCHTPHGVCGLKPTPAAKLPTIVSHTPHGVCGLKLMAVTNAAITFQSHPARGVWIETLPSLIVLVTFCHTPHGVCGLKPAGFKRD